MRYYFYFVFIFFVTYVYFYDRSVKLNVGMSAEEEVFEKKIFFICLRVHEQKNKINFEEKTDDDAGIETFYIFSRGSILTRFNFY